MVTLANTSPFIHADNISKTIGMRDSNLIILQDLTLSIEYGQALAITGVSGSGKTTLLGILAGLDMPSTGKVMLGGVDFTTLSEDEKAELRRDGISFIFQNFQLLTNLTALENVMLALELQRVSGIKEIKAQARELLIKVGLGGRLQHYPGQLSGGEQQRVGIARAFITKPKILFADEPTANIDQKTASQIIDLLFALQSESRTTLVIVTHDLALAERCSIRYKLENGKLRVY